MLIRIITSAVFLKLLQCFRKKCDAAGGGIFAKLAREDLRRCKRRLEGHNPRAFDNRRQNHVFRLHHRAADNDFFDVEQVYHSGNRRSNVTSGAFEHQVREIVAGTGFADNVGNREFLLGHFSERRCAVLMKTAARAAKNVRSGRDIFKPRAFFVNRQIAEFASETVRAVPDFIVENKVIVELKAKVNLEDVPLAQAKNYVVAYDFEKGLLINFGAVSLQYKLIFNAKYPSKPSAPELVG